jgi:hypothetical protein
MQRLMTEAVHGADDVQQALADEHVKLRTFQRKEAGK